MARAVPGSLLRGWAPATQTCALVGAMTRPILGHAGDCKNDLIKSQHDCVLTDLREAMKLYYAIARAAAM